MFSILIFSCLQNMHRQALKATQYWYGDEAGKRCFAPSEWLTHQQIRGYFSGFSVKKQKERNTGKRLKLGEAVDDEDLQSTISVIVALEHSEAVSTITTEVQESDD